MKTTTLKKETSLLHDLHIALCFILFVVIMGGCHRKGKDDLPIVYSVKLQNSTTLGSYLTDKDGRTLYYFANDSVTVNTCVGGCANVWPVFSTTNISASNLSAGLAVADFGQITTSTGAPQTTYKGRPLYYFAPAVNAVNTPEAAGLTSGEGVGGVWFVAKPDYTLMLTRAQLVGNDAKKYIFDTLAAGATPAYSEGNGKSVYFTDAKGVSLYIFKNDKFNKNNYTSATDMTKNAVWPIYEMDKIVVPSVLDKTQFAVIDVFGKKQLTYKGWPLYYFQSDAMAMGATKGVSVPVPGVWPVGAKGLKIAPAP